MNSSASDFLARLDGNAFAFLADHAVNSLPLVPGSAMVAACLQNGISPESFTFKRIVTIADTGTSLQFRSQANGSLAVFLDNADEPVAEALLPAANTLDTAACERLDTAAAETRYDKTGMYRRLARHGNHYGDAFQIVEEISLGDRWAVSRCVVDPQHDDFRKLTTLLDASTHTAAGASGFRGGFTLNRMGAMWIDPSRLTGSVYQIFCKLTQQADESTVYQVRCDNESGETLYCINQLTLNPLRTVAATIGLAGTFSLDPLEEIMPSLADRLGIDIHTEIADYNQLLQNLASDTGVFDKDASNIALLRLQDLLMQGGQSAGHGAADSGEFDNLDTIELPDGRVVAQLNDYESRYVHKEIFIDKVYDRHGVTILDGDTVVDIGANIGLFSIFASEQASDVSVIVVEPSPVVLPLLKANLKRYVPSHVVYEAGAAGGVGVAEFTAYRKSSVFSSFAADAEGDKSAIEKVVRNMITASGADVEGQTDAIVDFLMQSRLDYETYECKLISVSDIIDEQHLESIGLLKIDAEKSEQAILEGIRAEHWPLIQQVIIELHTQSGQDASETVRFLTERGFSCTSDEESMLDDSGLVTLYAIKESRQALNATRSKASRVAERRDLLIDYTRRFAANRGAPLTMVVCPSTEKDPHLKALLEEAESEFIEAVSAEDSVSALRWDAFAKGFSLETIEDSVGENTAHIPFTSDWYVATGASILKAAYPAADVTYKVLAMDCDNTLWDGVVGEVGVDGIRIDDIHLALQRFILEKIEQGMLLVLVSKNNEHDVMNVLENRSDMLIRPEHIVAHRINWDEKYSNVLSLASELNLGENSFVFVDDSSVECAKMRELLPDVMTIQFDFSDDTLQSFLDHFWLTDSSGMTTEDAARTEMYRVEKARAAVRDKSDDLNSFIESLDLRVVFEPVSETTLDRASQMTMRTNQFNLTTLRQDRHQLSAYQSQPDHYIDVLAVSDRFGDYGITGLIMYRRVADELRVDNMLLSCRVLGRGVEIDALKYLGERAKALSADVLQFAFGKTEKNAPALTFLAHIAEDKTPLDSAEGTLDIRAETASSAVFSAIAYERKKSDTAGAPPVRMASASRPDSGRLQSFVMDLGDIRLLTQDIRHTVVRARPDISVDYVQPDGEFQTQLADVWQSLLGLEKVGVNDNFFELGGTSLKAIEMISLVHSRHAITLSAVDVFASPTIAQLDRSLSGAQAASEAQASVKEAARARRKRVASRRR